MDQNENSVEAAVMLEQATTVLKPVAALAWLFTPSPLLDHHKPVELMRQSEHRRVLGAIDALAEGVFV
jgi:hypothetical protein